jgi:DUF1365 family protein
VAKRVNPTILYTGHVSHIRHTPFRYRFRYAIWMLCVDLDRIDEIAALSKIFAHNRFGLTALHDKDHGFRDGSALRLYAQAALAQAGLSEYGATIRFIAMPRILGYGFNPISFYFCYDSQGALGAVLHQVKSTFGDQIGYVMPVATQSGVIHQSAPKSMHVSPFFDMQGGYRFALTPPGEKFAVSIQYGAEVKRLTATMVLHARPFSDSAQARLLLKMPFTSLKVIAAIHWQALKLFFRGAKFHAEPNLRHAPIITGTVE